MNVNAFTTANQSIFHPTVQYSYNVHHAETEPSTSTTTTTWIAFDYDLVLR
jgi:hypothetical protein